MKLRKWEGPQTTKPYKSAIRSCSCLKGRALPSARAMAIREGLERVLEEQLV